MSRGKSVPGFSLNSFVAPTKDDWYKKLTFQDSIDMAKEKMVATAENFVAIGYFLKHIWDEELYKNKGYHNIWECAESELHLNQSTASRYIKICRKFSANGDSPYLDDKYKEFGKSQLQELLSINDSKLIEKIKPDMSVRQIQRLKSEAIRENSMEEESIVNQENTDSYGDVLFGQTQEAVDGTYREFKASGSSMNESIGDVPEENCNNDRLETHTLSENVTGILYDLERIKILLPGTIGETVYFYDGDGIKEGIIDQITLRKSAKTQFRVYSEEAGASFFFEVPDFGSFLFYTYEEAEQMHNKITDKCIGFGFHFN